MSAKKERRGHQCRFELRKPSWFDTTENFGEEDYVWVAGHLMKCLTLMREGKGRGRKGEGKGKGEERPKDILVYYP